MQVHGRGLSEGRWGGQSHGFHSKNRSAGTRKLSSCIVVTGDKLRLPSWDQLSIKSSGVLAQEEKWALSVLFSTPLPFYSAGRNGSLKWQITCSAVDICHKMNNSQKLLSLVVLSFDYKRSPYDSRHRCLHCSGKSHTWVTKDFCGWEDTKRESQMDTLQSNEAQYPK